MPSCYFRPCNSHKPHNTEARTFITPTHLCYGTNRTSWVHFGLIRGISIPCLRVPAYIESRFSIFFTMIGSAIPETSAHSPSRPCQLDSTRLRSYQVLYEEGELDWNIRSYVPIIVHEMRCFLVYLRIAEQDTGELSQSFAYKDRLMNEKSHVCIA